MAKFVADAVLDAALDEIRTSADLMVLTAAQPADYAAAVAAQLADVTMVSGDFTLANGATSGRKLTVAAKAAVPVDASGTAGHVCLLDTAGSRLLYVTTSASTVLTSPGTVDIAAWDIEIADPA